ncbi:helix-turn-helix domain-containing protein [Irregularibacter muris]|uniref:Helix-turn-helix domain-containing protein n=1 Tax=Irregularibacter muris TaxID=1796619 RepID=A0AAE3HDC0_9FIRM|nr:sugar diacid recognition domain-containing protein [Irregularibacter muris]MCR1898311.1 helix-turn-helix domain-containing protein [Irregularibacter muris]
MHSNLYISERYLQSILYEMKEIVEQDLIFMNPKGEIIASTDPERLGSVHYGAIKVAKTRQDLVIHSHTKYRGAKKGINMPVILNNKIIGVIGITGDSNEIEKYVKIIKRLTEILVRDGYIKDLENNEMEKDRMIMESLLFNDREIDENYIIKYKNLFNITDNIPRIILVATVVGHENKRILNKDKVHRLFRLVLKDEKTIISLFGNNIVIMVEVENEYRKQIHTMIGYVKNRVKQEANLHLKFGIGDVQRELSNIKKSYIKASDALKWSLAVTKKEITYYDDMDTEILFNNIPSNHIHEYIDKVLGRLNPSELNAYSKISDLYEKHNGSIKRISEELFIHKNTLQYKINKLAKITGYDMRILHDFTVLRTAFILRKFNE